MKKPKRGTKLVVRKKTTLGGKNKSDGTYRIVGGAKDGGRGGRGGGVATKRRDKNDPTDKGREGCAKSYSGREEQEKNPDPYRNTLEDDLMALSRHFLAKQNGEERRKGDPQERRQHVKGKGGDMKPA